MRNYAEPKSAEYTLLRLTFTSYDLIFFLPEKKRILIVIQEVFLFIHHFECMMPNLKMTKIIIR